MKELMMEELIVTFGQIHTHNIKGKIFDKDCVCVIKAPTISEANTKAFEVFKGKFHQHVDRKCWDSTTMKYFPRGYIELENN